jgi:hypothetical protein
MPNEFATLTQHSAEYFGDSRDYQKYSVAGGALFFLVAGKKPIKRL